jgi:predicted SnoaL-like aldol condensation-catalyzing enzyme
MHIRPPSKKNALACASLAAMLILFTGQSSHAATWALLNSLPPLPDQKEWDAAIEQSPKDLDPKSAASRHLVMEAEMGFAKSLRYGHVREIFEHYIAPNYIQYNPNVEPGREGIIHSFEAGVSPPEIKAKPGETPPRNSAIPTVVVAQGDYVALVFEIHLPDPADPSKTYIYNPVTIFRVQNGQIVEHWGGSPKAAK